jgi:hypothetical protein
VVQWVLLPTLSSSLAAGLFDRLDGVAHPALAGMGVDLGRGDRPVTQQRLDNIDRPARLGNSSSPRSV